MFLSVGLLSYKTKFSKSVGLTMQSTLHYIAAYPHSADVALNCVWHCTVCGRAMYCVALQMCGCRITHIEQIVALHCDIVALYCIWQSTHVVEREGAMLLVAAQPHSSLPERDQN